ncbi:MAG: histidine--tRNA ligase [Candidatus Aenigmatarchaeota archaeon]
MKFQPPKGMKDFTPGEMVIREYVFQIIKKIFESYGFESIETPALEYLEVLTAKSGSDVVNQIYKVETRKEKKLGLRFDLTVSLARFLANNPQIPKPFKRYMIAPVWRYEEPQAGRFRQFYQADIDICGSSSMEADVECIACAVACLKKLGFEDFKVRLNNRKVLEALVEITKESIPKMKIDSKNLEIFRAIDKLDKIGVDGVKKELVKIGLPEKKAKEFLNIISLKGNFEEVWKMGLKILEKNKKGLEGLEELKQIYEFSKVYGIERFLILDFSLARGLDYYTGPIFEIEIEKGRVGSVAGGGRYDKLVELLGGKPTPATGISIGVERIIEIIKERKMIKLPRTKVRVFVANVDANVKKDVVEIAENLRMNGIPTQVDLMGRNLTKQLEYANSVGIPFVVIVGKKEVESKKFKLKNMIEKTEKEVSLEEIIREVSSSIQVD